VGLFYPESIRGRNVDGCISRDISCVIFTLRCAIDGRRALPSIPTTAITTTSTRSSRQQQTTFKTTSPTAFDDDGHYTDIHCPLSSGEATIPTWRQSLQDDPDHYNYLEFNQLTSTAEQGQLPAVYNYASIGSDELRSRVDAQGYLEPVEETENENHNKSLEEQSSSRNDHSDLRSEENYANRQGYDELDPSVVEELRRPQRPSSYTGIDTRSHLHSYLELVGYAGVNSIDDAGTAAHEGYQGLDPAEVEELRRRRNTPHDYAGLGAVQGGNSQGDVNERGGYEGLNPAELEELRLRARQPPEYAGLRDNVEHLDSHPIDN